MSEASYTSQASSGAKRVLLVYPPHTRNTEPPLGISLLAADLRSEGIETKCIDLNCTAGPTLARKVAELPAMRSHRTHRAIRHVERAILRLQSPDLYQSYAQYRTALDHYAAALHAVSNEQPWTVTPSDYADSRYPDYGVETCQAALTMRSDSPFFPLLMSQMQDALETFSPTLIGISVIYRTQFIPALVLAGRLRETFLRATIVLGGSFLSSLQEPVIKFLSTEVGPVVPGDGEPFLRTELGLPDRQLPRFRTPDFRDFNWSAYFAPIKVIPLTTSRGCYWSRCVFCAETRNPFHQWNPDSCLDALHHLADASFQSIFHFTDNALPPSMLQQLAHAGSPAPWYGFVRATPELKNLDYVRALARSGCRMLQLGLETPVQRLLDDMHKGIDAENFPLILKNLREAGIRSYVYVMLGYPAETLEDRERTLGFLAKSPIDFLNASLFRLPPCSTLASRPDVFGLDGIKPPPEGSLYATFESDGKRFPELRRWMSKRFLRHPSIRSMVSRTPRYFKSSHAVFF